MSKNQKEETKSDQQRPQTIKELVTELEKLRNSTVISYITRPPGIISSENVMLIVDNLENVKVNVPGEKKRFKKLDLFLNSGGGSIDDAYKIVTLCREFAEEFNVIVPHIAKSAATLICLGADEIVMTPVAELGPLDPIIKHPTTGEAIPARAIRDFLELANRTKASTESDVGNILESLIAKLDPWIVGSYETATKIGETYARQLLSDHMLKDNPKKAEYVARVLAWEIPSHNYAISREEASGKYNLKVVPVGVGDAVYGIIKTLLFTYGSYMTRNKIIVLSGTRDINRIFQTALTPSPKIDEQGSVL